MRKLSLFKKSENRTEQRRNNTKVFGLVLLIVLTVLYLVSRGKAGSSGSGGNSGSGGAVSAGSAAVMEQAAALVTTESGTENGSEGRPESGTVFYRKYQNNPAVLQIRNDTGADFYAKCSDGLFNSCVISFYLRAGEETTLDVPVGYFELHIATGEKWENEEKLFGEDTVYLCDTLQNGLEFGRKRTCEFTVESGFVNMKPLAAEQF